MGGKVQACRRPGVRPVCPSAPSVTSPRRSTGWGTATPRTHADRGDRGSRSGCLPNGCHRKRSLWKLGSRSGVGKISQPENCADARKLDDAPVITNE
ncbi:hypothetical protein STRIP9103_07949 [Streptomyces ipomoeae 91-03]|uniref:Uncharacterized protein n=1 Tax=Streptomyces ipomoeae 91-03 TaxID=698759 RepID=L1L445_9ACTN|nr:hypothetical protein STRIP9103_07949 [Streptomyces ipomoeae 91-03]